MPANQNLILIEGAATYERILAAVQDVEPDEGIRHIQDFLKIYPEFAQAHNDLAVLYYRTENNLKTLAHYEKAHKLDPGNITYRKNLADFYFVELEWSDDAIHTYLNILKDNPFDTEALNTLGAICLKLGRKQQAQQYFSRTLQLDANNQEARQALQHLTISTDSKQLPQDISPVGRVSGPVSCPTAATAFRDMFTPDQPNFASTHDGHISNRISANGNDNEASGQVEPARSADEIYRDALAMDNSGNSEEAIRLLEKLVKEYADFAPAHNDLGVLYQRKGDIRASRHHHEEAVRLKPSSVIFQKNLADLLCVECGELEQALGIYVRLQAKAPQDIEILKAIASICRMADKPVDARFFLEKVLALQPWDRDAQEALTGMEDADKAGEFK